jgi:hypothetical protein
VTFVEMERALRRRLETLPPAARAELLHVLMLPDFERVDRIGSYWGNPKTRTFAELLIDCEEDRTLRVSQAPFLMRSAALEPSPSRLDTIDPSERDLLVGQDGRTGRLSLQDVNRGDSAVDHSV